MVVVVSNIDIRCCVVFIVFIYFSNCCSRFFCFIVGGLNRCSLLRVKILGGCVCKILCNVLFFEMVFGDKLFVFSLFFRYSLFVRLLYMMSERDL